MTRAIVYKRRDIFSLSANISMMYRMIRLTVDKRDAGTNPPSLFEM